MDKNHPLAYILRKRKAKDLDIDFRMICYFNYFQGMFDNKMPVDESDEAWEHLKKLLKK